MTLDTLENEIPEEKSGVNEITDATTSEITKTLDEESKNKLIGKIYTELGAEFMYPQMITKETKGKDNEYTKISIRNTELAKEAQRSEPEVAITIQPNGNVFFKINPYDRYEEFYFVSKEITPEQLSGEIKSAKDILKTGNVPQNSLLEKVEYPTSDEDIQEWVAAYEEARETYAQKKNDRENTQE